MGSTRPIHVISDSTGATAERVVRAALLQFPQSVVEIQLHARVRTRERADPILARVADEGGLLVFSVVSPELSGHLHRRTAELKIEAVDVIGVMIGRLGAFLGQQPVQRPGALLPLSEEYFRRIEAVTFSVKNDAGSNPRAFREADLVLAGVSRTSKTALATLLAQRGLKVANLTVVADTEPPQELFDVVADRVVGLTIDVDSLCAIRQERLRKLGMPPETQYAMRPHVEREVQWAEALFARPPAWTVVDMTGRSIDETAGIILEALERRRPPRGAGAAAALPSGE